MKTINGLAELRAHLGQELGTSGWHEVNQDAVNDFARVTGDDQWIHIDRERAAASPLGSTIVHGYFTLSLGPLLANEAFSIEGFDYGLNYGLNKVRFPAPLPVGSRVRLRAALTDLEDVHGGVQVTVTHTFEREGGDKPVCVAETLGRLYGGATDAG